MTGTWYVIPSEAEGSKVSRVEAVLDLQPRLTGRGFGPCGKLGLKSHQGIGYSSTPARHLPATS